MIFNSYLTGEERADAIEESRYDLIFSRANMMFEMVNMRLEQNIKEAEFKVFSEGGTYDDYQYYIEEAEAEAAQKKQSIIGTIWNAIKKIIKTIGEKLASIKVDAGDENTEVEIEEDAITDNNAISGVVSTLSEADTAVRNNDAVAIGKIALKIGAITIGAGAVAAGAVKMVKKKKGELMGLKKTADVALDKANTVVGAVDTTADKLDSGADKDTGILRKAAEAVRELGNNIYNKILKPIAEICKKLAKAIGAKVKGIGNKVLGKWRIANEDEKDKPEAREVVADDTADDKFDKSKQIKLADITKKVPNAKVGDFVIKDMASKSADSNAEGEKPEGEQQANDNNQNSDQQNVNNDSNQNTTQQNANDNNQNSDQQNNEQSTTSQNNNEAGVIAVYGNIKKVNSSYKGKNVKTVVNGTDVKKNKIGIDSNTISEINKNNPGAIKVNDKVAVESGADDIIRDEDVNPFIEETDINNEQYDIELAELADMFNNL